MRGEPGPAGRDGRDGQPGVAGPRGEKGDQGVPGERGLVGEAGTRGERGEKGDQGPAGRDGTLDGLELEWDGERRVRWVFPDGHPVPVRAKDGRLEDGWMRQPTVIHRGTYDPTVAYEPCDVVTFSGANWIAKAPTSSRPGDGNPAWVLSVKRGRDGKQGPPGPPGKDLTQLGPDGSKW